MSILASCVVPHPPLIIPEVGRGEEKQIRKTIEGYEAVMRRMAALEPDTVVVITPHSVMYSDYFHISPGTEASGSLRNFRAPQVRLTVQYDSELVREITREAEMAGISAGTMGERDRSLDHATLIPLLFLNRFLKESYQLVRIGLSGFPSTVHYAFGQCIARAVERLGRRVILIASGDLSHKLQPDGPYGFAPEGPVFDARIMKDLEIADFGDLLAIDESFAEKAAECGLRSFQIMAGALDRKAVEALVYSHEDVTGVGYGTASFLVSGEDPKRCYLDAERERLLREAEEAREKQDIYVRLARASIEKMVKSGQRLRLKEIKSCLEDPESPLYGLQLPEEMTAQRAGVFVSLHKEGQLRGCIGTISATRSSIAEEILENAVSACRKDPRFSPVRTEALPFLIYSVDVLGDAEKISSMKELDVKRYGVIVSSGYRRGLLLPDLDGVDSPEQQIDIARQKAGIGKNEPLELQRFEVVRHS